MSAKGWRAGAVLIAAAFQIGTVVYLGSSVSGGDAYTYLEISRAWLSVETLLAPQAFESNFWPAGYPGFLALLAWAGESQVLAVRLAQVGLAAGVAIVAGRIADSVSRRAGTVTTVLVALSPTAVWSVWAIGYELLLALLLACGLWLVWAAPHGSKWGRPYLGGLLLGLALIVQFRSAFAVVVLLLVVGWRASRVALVALTGVALPVAAWSLRSLVAVGNPAPWSANGPYNLWNGNNPAATGHNVFPLPALPDGVTSYTEAALTWISSNPLNFLSITARKFLFLFEPTRIAGVSDPFPGELLVSITEFAVAGLICVGLVLFIVLRMGRADSHLARMDVPFLFSAAYLLPNVFFIVEARFAIPVHALLVAISVSAFLALFRFLRERRAKKVSTPAG